MSQKRRQQEVIDHGKKNQKKCKYKKVVYRGIAVGMAAVMGGVPVSAAAADVSKEETVYVNAGCIRKYGQTLPVSNWLKNSNGDSTIKDKSDLQDIENVKGDETYTGSGDSMSWQQTVLIFIIRVLQANNFRYL